MKRRRRRLWFKKRSELIRQALIVFLLGLVFWVIWWCMMGMWSILFQNESFEAVLSSDVWWVLQVMPDQKYDKSSKAHELKKNIQKEVEAFVQSHFDFTDSPDFWSALRPPLTMVGVGDGDVLFLAPYRNESQLREATRVWGKWEKTKNENEIRFFQSESSEQALAIYKDVVLFAQNKSILERGTARENTLQTSEAYKKFKKVLPKGDISMYVQWSKAFDQNASYPMRVYYPVIRRLGEIFPAFGGVVEIQETGITVDGIVITNTSWESVSQKKGTQILSQWVPKDILFWWNGFNLESEYAFLESLIEDDEQAKLVWKSFLKDMQEKWNLEKELILPNVAGEYGFMAQDSQYADDLLYSLLMRHDERKSDALEHMLKTIQGRFTPNIEVVELSDGTEREDLVAQNPESILWEERTTSIGWTYKTAPEAVLQKIKLTFAVQDDWVLLSSEEKGILGMEVVGTGEISSIQDNEDFSQNRRSFPRKMKEWGFVNISQLKHVSYFKNIESSDEISHISKIWKILSTHFRNITIGKENTEEGIFFRLKFLFGK